MYACGHTITRFPSSETVYLDDTLYVTLSVISFYKSLYASLPFIELLQLTVLFIFLFISYVATVFWDIFLEVKWFHQILNEYVFLSRQCQIFFPQEVQHFAFSSGISEKSVFPQLCHGVCCQSLESSQPNR